MTRRIHSTDSAAFESMFLMAWMSVALVSRSFAISSRKMSGCWGMNWVFVFMGLGRVGFRCWWFPAVVLVVGFALLG